MHYWASVDEAYDRYMDEDLDKAVDQAALVCLLDEYGPAGLLRMMVKPLSTRDLKAHEIICAALHKLDRLAVERRVFEAMEG
jgi:hypothetical protein